MTETNTPKKENNNVAILVGGLATVGLSVGGLSLASRNAEISATTNAESQTQSVINLPATNARLDSLEAALNAEKSETEREIEQLESKTNDQINRRELETYQYIQTLDDKKQQRVEGLERRIYRLEQEKFN